MPHRNGEGGRDQVRRSLEDFPPHYKPRGRPASPEMQPELPPLPPSALLTGKRDLGDSRTVGRSPGESHPSWEWAKPAQRFYFQSTACLSVLGGHCPGGLQLQPCPRHPVALLKTSATCCGFLQCKLVRLWPQHKGSPMGWVAPLPS